MAPSPVTLHAVPKLSMVMYNAIITACCSGVNPKMDCKTPKAAMIAPPGTPGAATFITPSIKMKPVNWPMAREPPCMIINATAQAVIFIALPERWIVAHKGTTKPAMPSLTALRLT